MTATQETNRERGADRRQGGRGGRRQADRGRPWWQRGLFFAALCVALRCWRFFRSARPPRGE